MHIGLIGGIGPAATDYYYRRLIATFARAKVPLDLTIVHADTPTLITNLAAQNKAAQVEIYMRVTSRLVAAGADCVVVTSIAGHFCIEPFKAVSPLPVVDMIVEVRRAIEQRKLKRIGILGTRTVMESRFYGGVAGVDIIPPTGPDLDAVHQAYVDMAVAGAITEAQRTVFHGVSRKLLADGAQAIMLGGTDLALAFDEKTTDIPIVDCAGIHADAVAALALA